MREIAKKLGTVPKDYHPINVVARTSDVPQSSYNDIKGLAPGVAQ
jgi:hypothetical protein